MSAKKHILVPRFFTEDDLVPGSHFARSARALAHTFHRMSSQEANALARQGRIRPLGASGKVWQLSEEVLVHNSRQVDGGRISLEIPFALQSFMESEMRWPRPGWVAL